MLESSRPITLVRMLCPGVPFQSLFRVLLHFLHFVSELARGDWGISEGRNLRTTFEYKNFGSAIRVDIRGRASVTWLALRYTHPSNDKI